MQSNELKINGSLELQTIKDDLSSLRKDIATLAREINATGGSIAHEGLDQLRATGEREFRTAEKHVREKPGQSLLLAFAAGLFASYVLGSRR